MIPNPYESFAESSDQVTAPHAEGLPRYVAFSVILLSISSTFVGLACSLFFYFPWLRDPTPGRDGYWPFLLFTFLLIPILFTGFPGVAMLLDAKRRYNRLRNAAAQASVGR